MKGALRRAMIFGSVMASFNVEEFGTERVQRLTPDEINQRFAPSNGLPILKRFRSNGRFQVQGFKFQVDSDTLPAPCS